MSEVSYQETKESLGYKPAGWTRREPLTWEGPGLLLCFSMLFSGLLALQSPGGSVLHQPSSRKYLLLGITTPDNLANVAPDLTPS